MLPSVLARHLQEGLCDYIETTFPMTNHAFRGSLSKMLSTKNAVFREPYISIRLPFRVGEETIAFEAVHPKYKPYIHQQKAYEKLTGEDGRSTLIATGTGSGKTECFLYPILEYCYHHLGERGIKALIVYPMNALASDQAKRIANYIYESSELRGNITAGMYVGGYEKKSSRMMTKDRIITDHQTLLSNPPDILLTNYKMLDYLLVRPKDSALWAHNKPDTLKYIAVDELHTFDGAQGTDLACLLRRLKAKLYTQQGYLCCVGTSATMGTKDSTQAIREYASSIFGEVFEDNSVITEDRLTSSEFFDGYDIEDFTFPTEDQCKRLSTLINEGQLEEYLTLASECWLEEDFDRDDILSDKTRIRIGQQLMNHSFMQHMIEIMEGNYVQEEYILDELKYKFPEILKLSNPSLVLDALFALISHGRTGKEGKTRPFLNVQVQFWLRELRRLLAKVSEDDIEYAIEADLNENQAKHYLPVVNCRDCGETGWVSIINERNNVAMTSLDTFYNLFFSQDDKIKMVYPHDGKVIPKGMITGRLCIECLQLNLDGKESCPVCGGKTIPVILPLNNIIGKGDFKQYVCPFCKSRSGLSLIGLRSATAISAEVSQLYASRFNDDKKLLAFSDNVQDAAHRAGFFNSRTWRFSLRGAIQQFALDGGSGLSLEKFQNSFIEYWHSKLSNEEFVALFIPPNMTWMRAYEKMMLEGRLGNSKEAKRLIEWIENRVKYEIMLEFGLGSRIGRTLEKSGCSVLSYNGERIREIVDRVRERTINEVGVLKGAKVESFYQMIIGFLHIIGTNGAFNDKIYNIFTKNKGNSYLLSNKEIKWMPGVIAGRNVPRFIYKPIENVKRLWNFDGLSGNSKYNNWIYDCIDEVMIGEELPEYIGNIILEELFKSKIIVKMPSPSTYSAFGINKSKVDISTKVSQFICDVCGTVISASKENSEFWKGAPCPRSNCHGHLYENADQELGYYGKLYTNGALVRINAQEHTGLLDRDDREALEMEFKRSKEYHKPWDANLLSSTPTLEMGIDIGDLSTIVLCSMPPAQAQFLQRTGRAGRKDGNALTIAVANAKPHDLYFYAEPMEMIHGVVEPPKIFLRASAVLERQFVAYCMDSWIKRGVPEKAIPEKIRICLNNLDKGTKNIYPFNFLHFVQNNLSNLILTFIQMFSRSDDELDENTIKELELFAKGNGLDDSPMHVKILGAFQFLKAQKDALQGDIKDLKNLLKEMEEKPKDSSYEEEIKELKSELYAISNVVNNLISKNVFKFMSDEGLLPNYAFPEGGIILKAVLFRKEDPMENEVQNEKRKYEKRIYEYSRNASSALSEFAPDNNFYVDGKKLKINQIDMTTAQKAKWRLCPDCSYGEENTHLTNISSCPRCGSVGWADSGQIRTMLKLKMVYSNLPYDKAQIGDESDDRTNVFYFKQLLVDVDEDNDIERAYQMNNDNFPFGYEFVKKATLREINFGEKDIQGESFLVSGVEDVRKGFRICKYCGRIQPKTGKPNHSYNCRAKNPKLLDNEPYEECLFLYREFITEALRILVPSTTSDLTNTRQESFIAAFMLGMKEYFGNVDHLRVTLSEVPVENANFRKQYLVIFDSIPGGTGYLKQLLQNENSLIEIFEKALRVLENCTCKEDSQKDGCYRCLYAYRQSRNIGEISRSTAIKLLRQILSGKENIEKIEKLDHVLVNPLFESELERQFIQALELMKNDKRAVEVKNEIVNEKKGFSLKLNNCAWEIEPQVTLDEQYGVAVKTRADFILWPRRKSDGKKPIAIFTDGFTYHKDRCGDDTLKREAIRRSNKFRVWTLSYEDVQSVFKNQGDYATQTLIPENMPYGPRMYKPIVENGGAEELQPSKLSPMELLIRYLESSNGESIFKVHAKGISMSLLKPPLSKDENAFMDWHKEVIEIIDASQVIDYDFTKDDSIFGSWSPRVSIGHLEIFSGISVSKGRETNGEVLPRVWALLDDIEDNRTENYQKDWNGFWQFYNVMQFSDNFMGMTKLGIQELIYSKLPILDNIAVESMVAVSFENGWEEIIEELLDEEAIEFATKLQSMSVRAPTSTGYELMGENSGVIGEGEMAWEEEKVVALLKDQVQNKDAFKKAGWIVFALDDDIPSIIKGGIN
jgi:DEAD/DEAH box helicase domain-containing protein